MIWWIISLLALLVLIFIILDPESIKDLDRKKLKKYSPQLYEISEVREFFEWILRKLSTEEPLDKRGISERLISSAKSLRDGKTNIGRFFSYTNEQLGYDLSRGEKAWTLGPRDKWAEKRQIAQLRNVAGNLIEAIDNLNEGEMYENVIKLEFLAWEQTIPDKSPEMDKKMECAKDLEATLARYFETFSLDALDAIFRFQSKWWAYAISQGDFNIFALIRYFDCLKHWYFSLWGKSDKEKAREIKRQLTKFKDGYLSNNIKVQYEALSWLIINTPRSKWRWRKNAK